MGLCFPNGAGALPRRTPPVRRRDRRVPHLENRRRRARSRCTARHRARAATRAGYREQPARLSGQPQPRRRRSNLGRPHQAPRRHRSMLSPAGRFCGKSRCGCPGFSGRSRRVMGTSSPTTRRDAYSPICRIRPPAFRRRAASRSTTTAFTCRACTPGPLASLTVRTRGEVTGSASRRARVSDIPVRAKPHARASP